MAQRADAFGDLVERGPQLCVLGHEHVVQRVEARSADVPVVTMRLDVKRIGFAKQDAQGAGRGFAGFFVEADIDWHVSLLCV